MNKNQSQSQIVKSINLEELEESQFGPPSQKCRPTILTMASGLTTNTKPRTPRRITTRKSSIRKTAQHTPTRLKYDPTTDKELHRRETLRLEDEISRYPSTIAAFNILKGKVVEGILQVKKLKLLNKNLEDQCFQQYRETFTSKAIDFSQENLSDFKDKSQEKLKNTCSENNRLKEEMKLFEEKLKIFEVENFDLKKANQEYLNNNQDIKKKNFELKEQVWLMERKVQAVESAFKDFVDEQQKADQDKENLTKSLNMLELLKDPSEKLLDENLLDKELLHAQEGTFSTPSLNEVNREKKKIVRIKARRRISVKKRNDNKENVLQALDFNKGDNKAKKSKALEEAQMMIEELTKKSETLDDLVRQKDKIIGELKADNQKLAKFLKKLKEKNEMLSSHITERSKESEHNSTIDIEEFEDNQLETEDNLDLKFCIKKLNIMVEKEKNFIKKISNMRENSNALEAENNHLKNEILTYKNLLDKTETCLNSKLEENDYLNLEMQKYEELKNHQILLEQKNKHKLLENNTQKINIGRLQNELEVTLKENGILKKELNNLKLKFKNQEMHYKEKVELEAKCIDLENKLANLVTGVVSVEHVKLLENDNKKLKKDVKEKIDDIEMLNRTIKSLEEKRENLNEKIDLMEDNGRKVLKKKQQLMMEIIQIEGKYQSEVEELTHKIQILKDENENLKFELEKRRKQVERVKEDNSNLESIEHQNLELVSQINTLKITKNSLNEQLKNLGAKLEEAENQIDDFKLKTSNFDLIEEKAKKLKERNLEIEGTLIENEAKVKGYEQTIDYMKQKELSNNREITSTKLELNKLEDILRKFQKDNNELAETNRDLDKKIEMLTKEVKERDVRLKKREVETANRIDGMMEMRDQRIQEIEGDLKKEINCLKNTVRSLENELEGKKKEIKHIVNNNNHLIYMNKEESEK